MINEILTNGFKFEYDVATEMRSMIPKSQFNFVLLKSIFNYDGEMRYLRIWGASGEYLRIETCSLQFKKKKKDLNKSQNLKTQIQSLLNLQNKWMRYSVNEKWSEVKTNYVTVCVTVPTNAARIIVKMNDKDT